MLISVEEFVFSLYIYNLLQQILGMIQQYNQIMCIYTLHYDVTYKRNKRSNINFQIIFKNID